MSYESYNQEKLRRIEELAKLKLERRLIKLEVEEEEQ